jgi:SP family sugar:H+ symporter-like MFS transporter
VSALQQLSGVNIVAVYAVSISKQVTSGELNFILPSIIGLIKLFATFSSFFLLARVGRRPILFFGAIISTIANALMMVGFFIKDSNSSGVALILVGIFMFIIDFGLTIGPVVWLYIPEIINSEVIPYSIAVNWTSTSLVIILFPILT